MESSGALKRLSPGIRRVPTAPRRRSGKKKNPSVSHGVATVAWSPDQGMDFKAWVAAGRRFGVVARCSQWWIGDWVQFGNVTWGEKYVEASRITGYDTGTLRNMAWVAAQFDVSLRSDKLSWSHHALLAPLEDEEKREWIDRAVADRLSVADLRIELKASQRQARAIDDEDEAALGEADAHAAKIACPHCGHEIELDAEKAMLLSPGSDASGAGD